MQRVQEQRPKKLILASASPRRQYLLAQMGIQFEVFPSTIKENAKNGESSVEYVLRLAEEKALDVANRISGAWIIGADTIVLINGEIFGKPVNEQEACQMLMKMRGQEHSVVTGFCVFDTDTKESVKESVETKVTMRELTKEMIQNYVQTEEPFDKAGGYAVQGRGSFLVKDIKGSYTNVVGLPLCELVEALERLGAIRLFDS